MRKLLFSAAFIAANFAFGQITLEKTYSNENVNSYTNSTETYYYTVGYDLSTIKIYNSDHTLKKQFSPAIPSGYSMRVSRLADYTLSKNIFNSDDLLEIVVVFQAPYPYNAIFRIYNEDGVLVKDFGDGYQYDDEDDYPIYHDNTSGTNKLKLFKQSTNSTEIYNLNSSSLAAKEIQTKAKLSAFPVPTNKILNVVNPKNGANKIEIYDTSGKLLLNKNFGNSESEVAINVENLPNGIYLYKVGDLSSKFIKN